MSNDLKTNPTAAVQWRVPQFTFGAVVVQEVHADCVFNHDLNTLEKALAYWERKTGVEWTAEIGSDGLYPSKAKKSRKGGS